MRLARLLLPHERLGYRHHLEGKLMRCYVANRMRGLPHYNWGWFKQASRDLRANGHDVVDPTEIDEATGVVFVEYDTDGSISDVRLTSLYNYDDVMRRDLDAVADCDAIVLGPDWAASEGARLERETAKAFGLRIFYGVEDVPDAKPSVPSWWAVTESVPDVAGRDLKGTLYPILDRVDQLRHKQRIGTVAARNLWVDETRVVDPETGGAKGQKLAQLGAVDPAALLRVAEVAGFGGIKYERYNFAKGYAWSLSFDALMRHLLAFWNGEDTDTESGSPHLAHAAWHCLALLTFSDRARGTDDRFPGKAA